MYASKLLLATGGKQTPPPFPPLHPSTPPHTHTRAPSHRKLMKQNYLKLKNINEIQYNALCIDILLVEVLFIWW